MLSLQTVITVLALCVGCGVGFVGWHLHYRLRDTAFVRSRQSSRILFGAWSLVVLLLMFCTMNHMEFVFKWISLPTCIFAGFYVRHMMHMAFRG